MVRPGKKRTRTLRVVEAMDLKAQNVLQIQFFNQGTSTVRMGDGLGKDTATPIVLRSGEGLTLGNPIYTEDFQKRIAFESGGTNELMVYIETFYPSMESMEDLSKNC